MRNCLCNTHSKYGCMWKAVCGASQVKSAAGKTELSHKLLLAKEASGKTFNQIAKECGLTNLYTAQLFFAQVSCPAWGPCDQSGAVQQPQSAPPARRPS